MIRELIVVEGFHDISAVRQAVDAELVATNGFALSSDTLARIHTAHRTCGVIVLTDPDPAGEQIRRRIEAAVGPCKHARLTSDECTLDGDVGIENARPEAIRRALDAARPTLAERRTEFDVGDLVRNGLQGGPNARDRRTRLGVTLALGYGNARQLLRRLNHLGVSREEFERAVASL